MKEVSFSAPTTGDAVCRCCGKKLLKKKEKACKIKMKIASISSVFMCVDCVENIHSLMRNEMFKPEYDIKALKKINIKREREIVKTKELAKKKALEATLKVQIRNNKMKKITLEKLKTIVIDKLKIEKIRKNLNLKYFNESFTIKNVFDTLGVDACKILRTQNRAIYLPLIKDLVLNTIGNDNEFTNRVLNDDDLFCDDVVDMALEQAYIYGDFEAEEKQKKINDRVITDFFNKLEG